MIDKDNNLNNKLQNDKILIEIIKFCKAAKSTREIIDHIHKLRSLGSKRSKTMLELSLKLNELEGLKALKYDYNSKSWIATKLGNRILKKYF